jgi:hypothetical protein
MPASPAVGANYAPSAITVKIGLSISERSMAQTTLRSRPLVTNGFIVETPNVVDLVVRDMPSPSNDADKEPREEPSCGRSQTSLYNGRRPHSSLDDRTPDQAYFDFSPLRAAA